MDGEVRPFYTDFLDKMKANRVSTQEIKVFVEQMIGLAQKHMRVHNKILI